MRPILSLLALIAAGCASPTLPPPAVPASGVITCPADQCAVQIPAGISTCVPCPMHTATPR